MQHETGNVIDMTTWTLTINIFSYVVRGLGQVMSPAPHLLITHKCKWAVNSGLQSEGSCSTFFAPLFLLQFSPRPASLCAFFLSQSYLVRSEPRGLSLWWSYRHRTRLWTARTASFSQRCIGERRFSTTTPPSWRAVWSGAAATPAHTHKRTDGGDRLELQVQEVHYVNTVLKLMC